MLLHCTRVMRGGGRTVRIRTPFDGVEPFIPTALTPFSKLKKQFETEREADIITNEAMQKLIDTVDEAKMNLMLSQKASRRYRKRLESGQRQLKAHLAIIQQQTDEQNAVFCKKQCRDAGPDVLCRPTIERPI